MKSFAYVSIMYFMTSDMPSKSWTYLVDFCTRYKIRIYFILVCWLSNSPYFFYGRDFPCSTLCSWPLCNKWAIHICKALVLGSYINSIDLNIFIPIAHYFVHNTFESWTIRCQHLKIFFAKKCVAIQGPL